MQRLAIEIYNFNNNLGPEILNDIFAANSSNYNTRSDIIIYIKGMSNLFLMVLKLYRIGLKKLRT